MSCPDGSVCFNQDRFTITIVFIIGLLMFIYIRNSANISKYLTIKKVQKEYKKQIGKLEANIGELKHKLQNLDSDDGKAYKEAKKEIIEDISRKEKEREIYFRRLGDPVEEPRRTYPFTKDIYDNVQRYQPKVGVNIPTRGLASDYQPIGILTNVDSKKNPNILQLFGRAMYPGSYRWQYYTNSDNFQTVKVQVVHKGRECMSDIGCDELFTGDLVKVPSYDTHFRAELYRLDSPAYIPRLGVY